MLYRPVAGASTTNLRMLHRHELMCLSCSTTIIETMQSFCPLYIKDQAGDTRRERFAEKLFFLWVLCTYKTEDPLQGWIQKKRKGGGGV